MRQDFRWLNAGYRRYRKWSGPDFKRRWISAGLGALLLLVIMVPYLIPMEQYRNQIESLISDATGYSAHVDSVAFSLFPSPEIKLSGLRITRPDGPSSINSKDSKKNTDELAADKAHIPLKLSSLLGGNIVITRLTFSNLLADQLLLTEFIRSLGSSDDEQATGDEQNAVTNEPSSFELHLVEATSLKLRLESGSIIGPYLLRVYPDMKTGFSKIFLSHEDKSATLEASNDGEKIQFQLIAENWVNPLGLRAKVASLVATGVQSGSRIEISSLDASVFQGKVTGKGELAWENKWVSSGILKSRDINLEKALQSFNDKTMSGRLDADCNFSLNADTLGTLMKNPALNCQYHIANGEFYKGDLEKAARFNQDKEQEKGASTPFDELSGRVALNNKDIEITDLNLLSTSLQVNGTVKIQKYNALNGRIEVGVKKTASLTSVPLKVSGTVNAPTFRPSDDAIAGATVGTVLLGPGIGTAIGVNVARGINKVFGLFKSENDDKNLDAKSKENIPEE